MNHLPCDLSICEIIVRKHLSVVRAELVDRLVNEKGIPPAKVAVMMGQSRACISQYLSKKRGLGAIPMSSDLDNLIDRWADAMLNGTDNIIICDICKSIRGTYSEQEIKKNQRSPNYNRVI